MSRFNFSSRPLRMSSSRQLSKRNDAMMESSLKIRALTERPSREKRAKPSLSS
jgi:hypothetical protein